MGTSRSQGRNSASTLAAALVLLVLVDCALAATVNVGGSSGWTLGYNYKTWASTAKVRPYDSLFFKYDPRLHNAMVVSKADYDSCKTTSPWAKHASGKDYIKFTKSGTYYIICGVGTHCKAGMKVAVTVKW
ncbi:hypothetical protein MPTK1_2g14890 [Marchantia polymorpha subsp. ruderalis]|uniref:Phytocyanin domain-containing protein n=2 Tax=Marchantia polymorpha TaxID=3197 RepID=A0A176WFI0_MARPO|nr:hypothetical protein AXG93_3789s1010 [Marchantia polymorpha subsp. ruderalis]PTQ40078.1 hypothetical protein MARPO_0042s0111 [Marchantia polymorpha]BBN02383.1 hypothetical protein Mp_2g14890 [Marchantia polymorpha subsp. ruderalis]|eukprot:PTQ40078.1 hypothetical protein MARPO_0042s0111 [Marchantia polymorpha]